MKLRIFKFAIASLLLLCYNKGVNGINNLISRLTFRGLYQNRYNNKVTAAEDKNGDDNNNAYIDNNVVNGKVVVLRGGGSIIGGSTDSTKSRNTYDDDVREDYFFQKLDHFSPPIHHPSSSPNYDSASLLSSFRQRYFYTNRFVVSSSSSSFSFSFSSQESDKGEEEDQDEDDDEDDEEQHEPEQQEGGVSPTNEEGNNQPSAVYAFLCVGGEGPPLDKSVLIDSVHCTGDMIELAKRLYNGGKGASIHLFALEHRYYGKSIPDVLRDNDKDENENENENENDDDDEYNDLIETRKYFQYLSSHQALGDIAYFISCANDDLIGSSSSSDSSIKWVTFGGSYPGMLSAWSRLRFPHLVYASVSSSAPVEAKLDFVEYMNVVAENLKYDVIGGSPECLELYKDGHSDLADLLGGGGGAGGGAGGGGRQHGHYHCMDDEECVHHFDNNEVHDDNDDDDEALKNEAIKNRTYVSNLFNICNGTDMLSNKRNAELFAGDGVIYIPFQENDPSCKEDLCNVEKICKALIHETNSTLSPLERLAQIAHKQHILVASSSFSSYVHNGNNNSTDPPPPSSSSSSPSSSSSSSSCININWEEYIASIKLMKEDFAWLWQTCTQFGYYQTCEKTKSSSCPNSRGFHLLEQDLEICDKLYGISSKGMVKSSVDWTNEWYGGWNIQNNNNGGINRILFVNGDVDPWSALAVTGEKKKKKTKTQHDDGYAAAAAAEAEAEAVAGKTKTKTKAKTKKTKTKMTKNPTIWVNGASHHFWTHAIHDDTDGEEIKKTREMIYNQVTTWLLTEKEEEEEEEEKEEGKREEEEEEESVVLSSSLSSSVPIASILGRF